MTINSVDEGQRTAARVVGFAYLFALVPAIFAEFYVPGQLIVHGNAAETARNIMAHERLFRLGIVSNLITFASDVVLITALYVVLTPVNRSLATAAAFFRLIETAVLVVVALGDLQVLQVLRGADYLQVFEPNTLYALARLSMSAHGDVYNVAFLFFGFGSPLFCYLWFKSRYIPRALAAFGVASSLWLGTCAMAFIISPALERMVTVGYYGGPIFCFELTMGLWLALKGIPRREISE